MAQYQEGTVNVSGENQTVFGIDTEWLANVSVGDVFKVSNVNATFGVGTVMSDTEIRLTSSWTGPTAADQNYQITRNFEPNRGYREVWQGDKDWPFHLTETIRAIGADMAGAPSGEIHRHAEEGISGEVTWENVIPAGFMLEHVALVETAGNSPVLSLGTSDGATDVFEDITINGSDITIVTINDAYSMSAPTDLDLNADGGGGAWNSGVVDVTLLMRRI